MAATKLWYPHYVRDFKAKTGHLSLAEKGAYRALIDEYWERQGPLPADQRALCRMIGAFPEEWEDIKVNVLAFFEERDDELHHARIDEEISKAHEQHKAKTERMAKAREKRWQQNTDQKSDQSIDQSSDQTSEQNTDQQSEQKTEQSTGQITSTPTPSPSQGSKDPPKVSFGNHFWSEFPHPPNRGDKSGTIAKFNKLSEREQANAMKAIILQKTLISNERKRNPDFQGCMASTFVNQRRWEGLLEAQGGEADKPPELELPDDTEQRIACEQLLAMVGRDKYHSFFNGVLKKNGVGWVLDCTESKFDMINNRFGRQLNQALGEGNWRHAA